MDLNLWCPKVHSRLRWQKFDTSLYAQKPAAVFLFALLHTYESSVVHGKECEVVRTCLEYSFNILLSSLDFYCGTNNCFLLVAAEMAWRFNENFDHDLKYFNRFGTMRRTTGLLSNRTMGLNMTSVGKFQFISFTVSASLNHKNGCYKL